MTRDDAPGECDRNPGLATLLPFLAPAAVAIAIATLRLAAPRGTHPITTLLLVGGGTWVLLAAAVPKLRRFLSDLGAWLLERVPFPILVVCAAVSVLVVTDCRHDAGPPALASFFLVLTIISARRAARRSVIRFVGVLLFIVFNAALLVGLDVLVRAVILPGKSHQSIFTQYDPNLGWRLRANFSVERKTRHFEARETTNRHGFRTPDLAIEKPSGTKRVLVLGDSHTEGYTVGDLETYARHLERGLAETWPTKVIALGVGGWSTDQEVLAYLHHGRHYQPDLVVLQVTHNDIPFNACDRYWRGRKPCFRRHGETLLLTGVPVPNTRHLGLTKHWLLRHSAIAAIVEGYLGRLGVDADIEATDFDEARRVTGLLLRDLKDLVEADDARLVIFDATPDMTEANTLFRKLAKELEIPFIDITPAFGGDIAAHRTGKKNDRHWNARGHAEVGRLLMRELLPYLDGRTPPK